MARLLLNLRNVPDDEADDVCAMLDAAGIAYRETPPGPFGISAGGIHVCDDADMDRARRLMDDYQATRRSRARAEYAAAVREGRAGSFWTVLRDDPLRVLAKLLAIVLLLAMLALPAVLLRGG